MSFGRLDAGDFPPLNKFSQQVSKTSIKNDEQIVSPSDFVRCRVGYLLNEYRDDLEQVMIDRNIGRRGNFIVAPLERKSYRNKNKFEALTDLVLPYEIWNTRVAVDLGHSSNGDMSFDAYRHFNCMLRHAMYLPTPVLLTECPNRDQVHVSLASIINARLKETYNKRKPLLLFKVSAFNDPNAEVQSNTAKVDPCNSDLTGHIFMSTSESSSDLSLSDQLSEQKINQGAFPQVSSQNGWTSESGVEASSSSSSQELSVKPARGTWDDWNSFRSHLYPDSRIGVCLVIDDDFTDDDELLLRWTGEPVRMIIIDVDQFTRLPGSNNCLKLNNRCRKFLRKVALSNSFKTSFVISGRPEQDFTEYLQYLDYYVYHIKSEYDHSSDYDDVIQPPLQPLSTNLDSSTYGVFELDSTKYSMYRDAMILAIKHLISNEKNSDQIIVTMILGAGRGPLVDSLIDAIKKVKTSNKFKIYALDKNPSSVLALRHKLTHSWLDSTGRWDVEVVEADMRSWEPGVKANIIVTELLGSLSDNELSPECIDGVWKLTTPETISIPREYSSSIAPICSYKLHQELYKIKEMNMTAFDQVHVVKLTNIYHIAYPLQLFKFEHSDLSLQPSERNNERYARLLFWSKIDTVCHGFAGYFVAKLFEKVTLSTLIDQETPNMWSWFPAFMPLEQPVQLPRGTKLEVHLWRRESLHNVWYEWAVTSPVRSRLYSQYGLDSVMSKLCDS